MPRVFDVIGARLFLGGEYIGTLDETLPATQMEEVVRCWRGFDIDEGVGAFGEANEELANERDDLRKEIAELEGENDKLKVDVEEARAWAVTTVNQLVAERDQARQYAEALLAKGYKP